MHIGVIAVGCVTGPRHCLMGGCTENQMNDRSSSIGSKTTLYLLVFSSLVDIGGAQRESVSRKGRQVMFYCCVYIY